VIADRKFPPSWPADLIHAFLAAEEAWWKGREDQYENPDNYRQARETEPDEMAEYESARTDGCCGSEDVTLDVTWDCNVVKIAYGFNHGH
jgi:hypothetical protein